MGRVSLKRESRARCDDLCPRQRRAWVRRRRRREEGAAVGVSLVWVCSLCLLGESERGEELEGGLLASKLQGRLASEGEEPGKKRAVWGEVVLLCGGRG